MKNNKIAIALVLVLACVLTAAVWAKQEKVLRIFSGGQVIQEHKIADIDYIEVQDFIAPPEDVKAEATQTSITITWTAVEGATYDVYRSADNVNFTRIVEGLTTNSYTDETPLSGSNYYRIKAIVNGKESIHTSSVVAALPPVPPVRGFMLLGTNGIDNLAIIDVLVMPTSRDTIMVENVLVNDGTITNPVKIKYSGSGYNVAGPGECMWLFGKNNSWRLGLGYDDYPDFSVIGTFYELRIACPPGIRLPRETALDFFPDRAYSNGTNLSRSYRGYITNYNVYGPSSILIGDEYEYYTDPVNRMANSSASPRFNFYPKVFLSGSIVTFSSSTPAFIYNTDADVLLKIQITGTTGTHCVNMTDHSYDPWRYDFRSEDRKLVWADNTFSSYGYNVFLRKDAVTNKLADICTMRIINANNITKEKFDIDFGVAKDIDKATIFSGIGCRRAIFYAVGSVLHQYDYERNLHMEMDLGDEITMIKPDSYSRNRTNDLMVATWDPTNKGTFMKLEIGTNPNFVEMAIRADNGTLEKWSTRVKIVDADWRYL